MARIEAPGEAVTCSFCGKSQKQVDRLVAGPGVYICNECVGLCNAIIDGRGAVQVGGTLASSGTATLRALQQELEQLARRLAVEIDRSDPAG